MKLRLHSTVILGLLISLTCLGATTSALEEWCDEIIISGGTYTVTPGYWTQDGVVIGQTWGNGGTVPGAGPPVRYITFTNGEVPNDFHYGGDPADPTNPNAPNPVPDEYDDGNGNVTKYSSWSVWSSVGLVSVGDVVELPIYAGSVPDLLLDTDWAFSADLVDPNLTLKKDGGEVYNGLLSAFNPASVSLVQVGSRRLMYLADVPTVTTWGMAIMVLLVVSAGTVIFRRFQRQTT